MCLGDVTADDDHRGIEEVDRAGEHFAQRPAGVTHHPDCTRVATLHEPDDIAASGSIFTRLSQSLRERLAPGNCFEAADVSAATDDVFPTCGPDVTDVSRRSASSPVDLPVGDDAATDAGTDLDQQQMLGIRPMHSVLAASHDVDVVVDEHRRAVAAREPLWDREVVPAGHDRRIDGPPALELDGPRHADPDSLHVFI
jgi:hypothetical protein